MKILIDNGHGVETPGKRSPNGPKGVLREYAYARNVADIIVSILRSEGYDAQLVVPEEKDVALSERVDRTNAVCRLLGANNVLFVSVHLNAASAKDGEWAVARGWSAYTTPGQTKSDILADMLYREAMKEFPGMTFRTDKTDGDLDKEANFYVLKNTKCPAVLTENFFMNDRNDYAFLLEEKTPARIAMVHVRAIKAFIAQSSVR